MNGGASDGIATFISPIPLGGLVGRCADAVAVSDANYRPISSRYSTTVALALVTSS